jgi:hypothetical protein
MIEERIVSWFSCGAASAVATKLAIENNDTGLPLVAAYCRVKEEHPDNMRFLRDCEKWFGQDVLILGNEKYDCSIYEVFRKTRYLKGPKGARCTGELKKQVRIAFERPTDVQVFGYTADEEHRVERFLDGNPQVTLWDVLIEHEVTKQDCLDRVQQAGIKLPEMYLLGYRNANCIGCVKGEAGYWNKIRVDFPDVFERMADMEEHLGRTVCKIEKMVKGKRTIKRVPLRELPPDQGNYKQELDIECGIFCKSDD